MQPRKLASQRVYDALRQRILEHDLAPGTRLSAATIAVEHRTSAMPVREALSMLQRDGLATNSPYVGYSVRQYTAEEIRQTYEIRVNLETLALRLSSGLMSGQLAPQVNSLLAEMDDALTREDYLGYAAINRRFHMSLLGGCPNSRLIELISNLWDGQVAYQGVFQQNPASAQRSMKEHRAIAGAVLRGDIEGAIALLYQHRLVGQVDVSTAIAVEEDTNADQEAVS